VIIYFRILGYKLLDSSEEGYHLLETSPDSVSANPAASSATGSSVDRPDYPYHNHEGSDSSNLSVHGNQVKVHKYSNITSTSTFDSPNHHYDEEIFVLDGYYEDIIAIDSEK